MLDMSDMNFFPPHPLETDKGRLEQHSLIPLCRSIAKDDRPRCTSHRLHFSRPRCIPRSTPLRKRETMPAHDASIINFDQGRYKISSSLGHKNKTVQELRFSFGLQTALNLSLRRGRASQTLLPKPCPFNSKRTPKGPFSSKELRISSCVGYRIVV